MKLTKVAPNSYRMTLHSFELVTLVSAVRWIVEGAKGSLPQETIGQMKHFLSNYDNAVKNLK